MTEAPFVRGDVAAMRPYGVTAWDGPIELRLDANEATRPVIDPGPVLRRVAGAGLSAYPDSSRLERVLAARLGIGASRVIVTAGGDDAIARLCLAVLGPGRGLIVTSPSFEMIARFGAAAGGDVSRVPWREGGYPVGAVIERADESTAMVAVASPNNPTGGVVSAAGLRRLSDALPRVLLLVDLAYTEFADEDLTSAALELSNTVVVRTFSKLHGLAGMRVGYAAGPAPVIRAMRCVGGPYPVSVPGLALAEEVLSAGVACSERIARVRDERARLEGLLRGAGVEVLASQGNFVCVRSDDAAGLWRGLCRRGVLVRAFSGADSGDLLRITCPGDTPAFERLEAAMTAVLDERRVTR